MIIFWAIHRRDGVYRASRDECHFMVSSDVDAIRNRLSMLGFVIAYYYQGDETELWCKT
jgi:hypothetical protein